MRRKILVVEDDADLAELLCFNLKQAGFTARTVGDGAVALKQARSSLPDLIVLDLMLPELDGFAVCEMLRHDPATAKIPILILTAVSSQLARLAGFEAGANEFMTKPFVLRDLMARIQALAGS